MTTMNVSEIQDIINLQNLLDDNGAVPAPGREAGLLSALVEWRDSTMHSGLVAGDPPVEPEPKAKRASKTRASDVADGKEWEPTPDPSESTDSDDEPGF